jgi:hypothetical protein
VTLPGVDTLRGQEGDDVILARDGEPDVVSCGPGHDRARLDRSDVSEDATAADPKGACEHVRRRAPGPHDGRGEDRREDAPQDRREQ